MLKTVKNVCDSILTALYYFVNEEIESGDQILSEILELFTNDDFLINTLDKSYSFRCIAPFTDLHNSDQGERYNKMIKEPLTFFRVRTKGKNSNESISKIDDILHVPYKLRDKSSNMRFNVSGLPALYLSSTSYTAINECDWDKNEEDLFASVFIPNDYGKSFKILNLTISQALINGIYNGCIHDERRKKLQLSMLKIFPLIIATSFRLSDESSKIKYNYLISQSLMRVANISGIDGIAYFSMKGLNEFQFPQGVNLAIPAFDISEHKQISDKCNGFKILKPVKFKGQSDYQVKSYINSIFEKYDEFGMESFTSKLYVEDKQQYYGDTVYGKFDNYLVSQLKQSIIN